MYPILDVTTNSMVEDAMKVNHEHVNDDNQIVPIVCVICDVFKLNCNSWPWISKEKIINNQTRLSVDKWCEVTERQSMNPILKSQYTVNDPDLYHILLSPRAAVKTEFNIDYYSCCPTCMNSLNHGDKYNAPPKFAFANGLCIGYLPDNAWQTEDHSIFCEVISKLIAPSRPFYFVYTMLGGKARKIKGQVTFFDNPQHTVNGVIQELHKNFIYVIMTGNFTMSQRQQIKQRLSLHVAQYQKLLSWFHENNPSFQDVNLDNPPHPIFIEPVNNVDDVSEDSFVENEFHIVYSLPSSTTPTQQHGPFSSNDAFSTSLLTGNIPTLEIFGRSYQADHRIIIEKALPIVYPFGVGGFDECRTVHISKKTYIQHTQDLSLSQFRQQDSILVFNHLYNRILSYEQACLKVRGKSKMNNNSRAEDFSTLSIDQLLTAIKNREGRSEHFTEDQQVTDYLSTVEACTRAIPHSREAAINARNKMFAMYDYYGCGCIFVTFSPTAISSIRVRMFALNKPIDLYSSQDINNISKMKEELEFHMSIVDLYPGAGVLEFRYQYDTFIKHLIGWDCNKHCSTKFSSVYGQVLGFAAAIEDQMNMSLHAHLLIWIKHLSQLKHDIYSPDPIIRSTALLHLKEYVSKIIQTTFGDDLLHHDEVLNVDQRMISSNIHETEESTAMIQSNEQDVIMDRIQANVITLSQDHDTDEPIIMMIDRNDEIQNISSCKKRKRQSNKVDVIMDRTQPNIITLSQDQDQDRHETCIHMTVESEHYNNSTDNCISSYHHQNCWKLVSDQKLRDYRSRPACTNGKGKTIYCLACNREFSPDDIFQKHLSHLIHNLPDTNPWKQLQLPLNEIQMACMTMQHCFMPYNNEEFKILQFVSNIKSNRHDSNHKKSCFKKGCECRFCFPFPTQQDTECIFDKDQKPSQLYYWKNNEIIELNDALSYDIVTKRNIYDSYTNAHNKNVLDFNGGNNNVQIGDIAHAFYTTLYVTKPDDNNQCDIAHLNTCNTAVRSIKNYILRTIPDIEHCSEQQLCQLSPERDYVRGLVNLLQGINGHVHEVTLSPTLASYIISNGSRFHFSHEFVDIFLNQVHDYLQGKDITYTLRKVPTISSDEDDTEEDIPSLYWKYTQCLDYIYRNQALQHICYYDFMMTYILIRKPRSGSQIESVNIDGTPKYYLLDDRHPGSKYMCLQKLSTKRIPVIHYPFQGMMENLKDMFKPSAISSTDHDDVIKEQYALSALLLFHPFNTINDIQDANGKYWPQFQNAILHNKLSPNALNILNNIQDRHYNFKHHRRTESDLTKSTQCSLEATKSEGTRQQELNRLQREAAANETNDNIAILEQLSLQNPLGSLDDEIDSLSSSFILNQTKLTPMINQIKAYDLFPTTLNENDSVSIFEPQDSHDNITMNTESDHTENSNQLYHQNENNERNYVHFNVITGIFQHMRLNNSYDIRNNADNNNQDFNTLSISKFEQMKNLDKKQQNAFRIIICSCILRMISLNLVSSEVLKCTVPIEHADIDNSGTFTIEEILMKYGGDNNLIMLLMGKGGCGKTFIIEVCNVFIKLLYDKLGLLYEDETFRITAMTGAAASNYQDGRTTHSICLLNSKLNSIKVDHSWAKTLLLVIDEISFKPATDLSKVDKHLKKMTSHVNKLYGGVPIIFAGDFSQLHPITGDPIFVAMYKGDSIACFWSCAINRIVYLENKHRFKDDPHWGEILERISTYTATDDDWNLINQRCITTNNDVKEEFEAVKKNVTYASYTNKERCASAILTFDHHIDKVCSADNSTPLPTHTLIIEAEFHHKNDIPFQPNLQHQIKQYCTESDIETGKGQYMSPTLLLYKNCPITLTSNDYMTHHAGKGSPCTLKHVKLKQNSAPRQQLYNGKYVQTVSVNDIEYITISKENSRKTFNITPVHKTCKITVDLKLPGFTPFVLSDKTKIKQFEISSGLSSTCHKLQGLTKEAIIILDWTYNVPNWIYVVLSRVKTMKGLFLMKPINLSKVRKIPKFNHVQHDNIFKQKEIEQNLKYEYLNR